MFFKSPTLSLGIAVLSLISFGINAYAAPRRPARPTIQSNPHPTSEFDTTFVKEAPHIGLLPEYTGKGAKFIKGMTYPNLKDYICYTLRYRVKEPVAVVHEWYCSALPGYEWRINPKQLTETQIIATHKKTNASVTYILSKHEENGFKTDLLIRYREARGR